MNDYQTHKSFKDDLVNQEKGTIKQLLFYLFGMIILGIATMAAVGWLIYFLVTLIRGWFCA